MTVEQSFLAFTIAAALLTVTPGLDTALVLRTAIAERLLNASLAGVGVGAGCLAWGLMAGLGLGAVFAVSELAFTALKIIGAAYLIWLGLRLILARRSALDLAAPAGAPQSRWRSFQRGFLTNILNPKVGLFYVSFLPQFIPTGVNVLAMTAQLAAIHALLGQIWFLVLILATSPVVRLLRRRAVLLWLDRLTGGFFIGFGVRLALEDRA